MKSLLLALPLVLCRSDWKSLKLAKDSNGNQVEVNYFTDLVSETNNDLV